MSRVLRGVVFSACVGVLACAQAARTTAGPTTSRHVLLGDEIQAASVATAYQAVARLRPEWLHRRGQMSIRDPSAGAVVVYLDGLREGGATALEAIAAENVLAMEYLDGSEATTRFGTGHAGGAILVRLR